MWDFGGQANFYSLHLLFLSRVGVTPKLLTLNPTGVWDFGGQANFYSLHLLFLSRVGVALNP